MIIFEEFCISLTSLASTEVLLDKLFGCQSLICLKSAVGVILFGQLTEKVLKNLKN